MIGDPTVVCRWPVSPKSKSGSSVAWYRMKAASPTRSAGSRARRPAPRSASGVFAGDRGADISERSCIDDVPRFDPAAARRHDAELHLEIEQLRAMAVAVNGDFDASGYCAARQGAVEIEMRRRAVDLDDGVRLGGDLEQPIVVEIVAGAVRYEAIGRMGDHRHQRMTHCLDVALHQLLRSLSRGFVQRRQHDVESLEHMIRKIELSVRQDVDLAAVKNRDLGMPLAERLDFLRLPLDAVN